MEQKHLNVTWETLWKLFFMILFVWILYLARSVVTAVLLAVVISTAFDPAVTYLERKRIPRILGTLIIYLAAIFLIGLIIYTFIPIALTELANIVNLSSKVLGPLAQDLNIEDLVSKLTFNLSHLTDLLFSGKVSLLEIAARFFGGLLFVIAIFALSFYLTLGKDGVEKFLLAILPATYEAKVINLYRRVARKIGRWLTGQLFVSLVVGVLVFIGLWALGVKYSLFLGLLAGILELIPYVGPILTGIVAFLIGLEDSLSLGIYVVILFTIIQQVENHVLVPLVMRYTTTLNPVVVIVALLVGGEAFGVIGLILAVPIAVLFQEIVEEWTEAKQSRRGLGL